MSTSTHLRHTVRIATGPDHPFDTTVEIDGRPVESARKVTVELVPDFDPVVTIEHDCWNLEIAGVATVDHRCGQPYEATGDDTGYLGPLRVLLRDYASRVLLAGDVTGRHREEVLDQIAEGGDLDTLAEHVARTILEAAPKVVLDRVEDLEATGNGWDDDSLVISSQSARSLDIDPGLHAVIRLPQAGTR